MKIISLLRKLKTLFLLLLIKYPVYGLSFLFSRQKNKWIVGSYYGFTDNAKYFYLDVCHLHKDINCYFILENKKEVDSLREKGIKCFYKGSLIGIWHLLTAKVYVGTHGLGWGIPIITSGGAIYIELWHGTPIKSIGYLDQLSGFKLIDNKFKRIVHKALYYFSAQYSPKALFVAPSPFVKELFSRSFQLPDSCFVEANSPRCEPFYWSNNELLEFSRQYDNSNFYKIFQKINTYKKIYTYLPTFRDSDPNYLSKANIDFQKLDELMQEKRSVFILKLHPRTSVDSLKFKDEYANIVVLPQIFDLYEILPITDVLITDYSSVYIDFLHKKEGYTVFFSYDYDEYISSSRELSFDYNAHISGIRVDSSEELLLAIEEEKYKSFEPKRKEELFKFFWGNKEEKVNLIDAIKEVANK